MLPIAVTGLTFSYLKLNEKINKYQKKKTILFFSIVIIYFLFKYDIFIKYEGFGYPDILLNNFINVS